MTEQPKTRSDSELQAHEHERPGIEGASHGERAGVRVIHISEMTDELLAEIMAAKYGEISD